MALSVEDAGVAPAVIADWLPALVSEVNICYELAVDICISRIDIVFEPLKLEGSAYLIIAVYKLWRLGVSDFG